MEYLYVPCGDCDGRGVDPGSLMQPEPCPSCAGAGKLVAPETIAAIARKYAGRAERSVEPRIDFEEREFRRTGGGESMTPAEAVPLIVISGDTAGSTAKLPVHMADTCASWEKKSVRMARRLLKAAGVMLSMAYDMAIHGREVNAKILKAYAEPNAADGAARV